MYNIVGSLCMCLLCDSIGFDQHIVYGVFHLIQYVWPYLDWDSSLQSSAFIAVHSTQFTQHYPNQQLQLGPLHYWWQQAQWRQALQLPPHQTCARHASAWQHRWLEVQLVPPLVFSSSWNPVSVEPLPQIFCKMQSSFLWCTCEIHSTGSLYSNTGPAERTAPSCQTC